MDKYKDIHIGSHIKEIIKLKKISEERIVNFFENKKHNRINIEDVYIEKTLSADELLDWSKLLGYNLFVFYQNHLQLYSPGSSTSKLNNEVKKHSDDYHFSKNYYSEEVIEFLLKKYKNNELTISEIMNKYNIPKTTLYRWIKKKSKKKDENTNDVKMKNIRSINYKLLYEDIYNDKNMNSSKLLNKINNINNYNNIIEIENMLFGSRLNQCLKSFDIDFIQMVLKKQKDFGLSNSDIALEYKLSRNTVALWKKKFNN